MTIINELQLAKELIRFPTVTPKDAGVMKFLKRKLKNLGLKLKFLSLKKKEVNQLKTYMQDWEIKVQIFVMLDIWMLYLQVI